MENTVRHHEMTEWGFVREDIAVHGQTSTKGGFCKGCKWIHYDNLKCHLP